MAKKNFLIEGGSGTGKSSVCRELQKRGYKTVDGDNDIAYVGDPETGKATKVFGHESHIWNVDTVKEIAADNDDELIFFCGGSRNFHKFIDVFDKVFVLNIDTETLRKRINRRKDDDWGGNDEQKEQILRLHATKEGLPEGITIDATQPLNKVVDAILEYVGTSSLA